MIVLATTYAVNPYKGSEDGMGWNFILQIARYHQVVAITRKNNKEAIENFMETHPNKHYQNISFKYYDLPYWMRFWKKGSKGAMLYYYLWQLFMPFFIKSQKITFDLVHNVNFHNDWTPSMLWVFGKPMVWGPIGHHPFIKPEYLKLYDWKVKMKNYGLWVVKNLFWRLDPFLKLTKWNASYILSMNTEVSVKLKGINHKQMIMPSVGSEKVLKTDVKQKKGFHVISVGRLVPLKGFDLTIKSFYQFLKSLPKSEQVKSQLTIVGSGKYESLYKQLVKDLGISKQVSFISWVDREELKVLYAKSHVFLFPSHEGAGMVVSEALSYGLPVISIANCGPGEFITADCGFAIKQNSYQQVTTDIAEALQLLYNDENLLIKMSDSAIKRHQSHFHWDIKGDVLHELYKQVLSKRKTWSTSLYTK